MMEALTREAQIQALTQRIASLEITTRKAVKQIDAMCMQMARYGVAIGGGHTAKDNPTKFITLAEQVELYLNSKLTPEQLAIIRTTKRDEDTSLLRRNVICDLYQRGVSGNMIGKVLKKDHNSVFYNLTLGGIIKLKKNKQYINRMKSKSTIRLNRTKKIKLDNF